MAYSNYDIAIVLSLANFFVLRTLGAMKQEGPRPEDEHRPS